MEEGAHEGKTTQGPPGSHNMALAECTGLWGWCVCCSVGDILNNVLYLSAGGCCWQEPEHHLVT